MASDDRITLIIEGLSEDEGQVRFSAFMAQLQSLGNAINRMDREAGDGKAASYFRIAELSYTSPARIAIEPSALPKRDYTGHLIIERLNEVATALSEGINLGGFNADLLEDIRALAKPVGRSVKSATIVFNGHQLALTEKITRQVDEALAIEDECEGSIEGMLEQINVHLGANIFHIFPDVGPKKVTCRFTSRLYDDAVSAVGKRVEVLGTLHYRIGASFPHLIAVTGIDPFPPDSELPDWEDLRGRAPDATGDLSSEAFVRELRDGWE